ncbi:Pathogenesis-related protein STH-2 [Vitis vinifera]|uniref:Pathogenesis-related protein STH-2 n=1 Tax=Vitis vinifera TaxID=29760 RepID=A0A438DWU7_VITVI|nr:Pathogenesis-related protein STH-2 [Vitis vinifera]
MGVTSFTQEFTCPIAPSRIFKALILDSNNLIPKLLPQTIRSIDVVQGDGGAGTIEQVNFTEAPNRRIGQRDFVCKYRMIEGDVLGEELESIAHEVKFEATDGGSICKMASEYHTKGKFEIKEEEIKAGKARAMGIYKVVEAYLLENPHVYA